MVVVDLWLVESERREAGSFFPLAGRAPNCERSLHRNIQEGCELDWLDSRLTAELKEWMITWLATWLTRWLRRRLTRWL
jgi:hypothetical protein